MASVAAEMLDCFVNTRRAPVVPNAAATPMTACASVTASAVDGIATFSKSHRTSTGRSMDALPDRRSRAEGEDADMTKTRHDPSGGRPLEGLPTSVWTREQLQFRRFSRDSIGLRALLFKFYKAAMSSHKKMWAVFEFPWNSWRKAER